MANINKALAVILKHEGGYSNNKKSDRGGETYMGISRKNWPSWEGWAYLDKEKLKNKEFSKNKWLDVLVADFYRVNFWNRIRGGEINDQNIATLLLDYNVHSGRLGNKAIQKLVGFTGAAVDGAIGPNTIRAINNHKNPEKLFYALLEQRRDFLTELSKEPNQADNYDGWMNRVDSFKYIK